MVLLQFDRDLTGYAPQAFMRTEFHSCFRGRSIVALRLLRRFLQWKLQKRLAALLRWFHERAISKAVLNEFQFVRFPS